MNMMFQRKISAGTVAMLLMFLICLAPQRASAEDSISRATQELFTGAETNNLEQVKRAIHSGADVRARNPLGQRAHDVAVDLNYMDVAHYILSMRPAAKKRPAVPPVATAAPVMPVAIARPKAPAPSQRTRTPPPSSRAIVAAISNSQSKGISRQASPPKPEPKPVKASVPARASPARRKSTTAFNFFGTRLILPADLNKRCLKKPDDVRICLHDLNWPKELGKWFNVDTVFYDGPRSLVLYQGNQLKQIHVLFRRSGFEEVDSFLTRELTDAGQTGALKRRESSQVYLGHKHRIVTWRGLKGSWPDTLEIRELDDQRWSTLPDEQHGVIRVYKDGADPVFKHVSSADFMLQSILSHSKTGK